LAENAQLLRLRGQTKKTWKAVDAVDYSRWKAKNRGHCCNAVTVISG